MIQIQAKRRFNTKEKKSDSNLHVSCETVKCSDGFDNCFGPCSYDRQTLPASPSDVKVLNMTRLHRTHGDQFTSLPLIYHLLPVCSKSDIVSSLQIVEFRSCMATSSVLSNTYFPSRPLQTRYSSPEVLILLRTTARRQ